MQLTMIQEAWLQDLESGKYKQGKEYLKDTDQQYCCLGVFAEKHCAEVSLKKDRRAYLFDGNDQELSPELRDKLGLETGMGRFANPLRDGDGNTLFADLAEMNDKGWTFKEIAAYIRANPENVFTNS